MSGYDVAVLFGPQVEKLAVMQRTFTPPFQAAMEAAMAPMKAMAAACPRCPADLFARDKAAMNTPSMQMARMSSRLAPVSPEPMAGRV